MTPTRRKRLARALASVTDRGYQDALNLVNERAEAGALPDTLDTAGMLAALVQLTGTTQGPIRNRAVSSSPAGEEDLHVRPWIPDYALGDDTYVPWYIGHSSREAVQDAALNALVAEFTADSDEVTDQFQLFLESRGYRSLVSPWTAGPYILPVRDLENRDDTDGTDEDDEDFDAECSHCGRPLSSETGLDDTGSRRCDDLDPEHRHHIM